MSDELKSSINIPNWMQYFLFILVVAIAFSVYYYIKVSDKKEVAQDDITIVSESLPDGYFKEFEETQAKEEAEKERKKVEKKRKLERQKKQTKQTYKAPPQQKQKVTAKTYFKFAEPKVNPDEAIRKKIQLARMQNSSETKTLAYNNSKNSDKFVSTNFNPDYGVKKDIASLPNNLTRVVTADRLFRALLVNDIKSDLGGKVTAQLEENVYGFHGKDNLIPAGTKFIGEYKPLGKIGMERMPIIWTRFITPDGVTANLTDAKATDTMGRSGVGGEVDKRYAEKYGLAFLITTLSSIGSYAIQVDNAAQQIAVQNLAAENVNLANRILEDQIDIKPRMRIPAGTRILINATRDLYIPKPENGKTKVKEIEL